MPIAQLQLFLHLLDWISLQSMKWICVRFMKEIFIHTISKPELFGILIGSVGILIHWYFGRWYFERWYFEPLPFNHLILSEFVQIFENYISHISRERHNRGLHRELHFSN